MLFGGLQANIPFGQCGVAHEKKGGQQRRHRRGAAPMKEGEEFRKKRLRTSVGEVKPSHVETQGRHVGAEGEIRDQGSE